MNKIMLLALIIAGSICFGNLAQAANAWTGKKTIIAVQVVNHGGFIIYFDSSVSDICTNAGTDSLYIYPGQHGVTENGVQSLLSVALSAFHTASKVNVMYDDTSVNCWGKYIVMSK